MVLTVVHVDLAESAVEAVRTRTAAQTKTKWKIRVHSAGGTFSAQSTVSSLAVQQFGLLALKGVKRSRDVLCFV